MLAVESEYDVDIPSGISIFVRCRALAYVISIHEFPVVQLRIAVPVDALDGGVLHIVFFIVREVRRLDLDDLQVRARQRHGFRRKVVVLVINLVALIPRDHALRVEGVGNEVCQDVRVRKR